MQNQDFDRFRLQVRRNGHWWEWSIHSAQYDVSLASGIAPSIEVAESVAEEIAGRKLDREFI